MEPTLRGDTLIRLLCLNMLPTASWREKLPFDGRFRHLSLLFLHQSWVKNKQ
jgi:hypothetical protein